MTGPGGRVVVRVGRLGRFGAGACPNLLQRRPAAGSAASRSAEYQRFASRVPARSGSLQQIWTTGVAAGPCTDGDLLVRGPEAEPTGRGPLHGRRPWRSLRSWTDPAPTPGCRGVHFALERALLTAPFECKMHISRAECTSRRAQDRPAPTTPDGLARTGPGPRTTTPGAAVSSGAAGSAGSADSAGVAIPAGAADSVDSVMDGLPWRRDSCGLGRARGRSPDGPGRGLCERLPATATSYARAPRSRIEPFSPGAVVRGPGPSRSVRAGRSCARREVHSALEMCS